MAKRPTSTGVKKLFARTDSEKAGYDRADLVARQRKEALGRLLANQDFAVWFYGVVDNMFGFIADTRELTPFGQGIRAAVGKMEEGILLVPEGIKFLTSIHQKHFRELHEGIVRSSKDNNNIGTDK